MDKELQKLINEYMPKRYYGHEARRYAGVIAKLYAEQQLKNCNLQNVSNNEVAVCDKCEKLQQRIDELEGQLYSIENGTP